MLAFLGNTVMLSDSSFDILRPELVWVEGRCYRKFPIVYPEGGEDDQPSYDVIDENDDEPATCLPTVGTVDDGQVGGDDSFVDDGRGGQVLVVSPSHSETRVDSKSETKEKVDAFPDAPKPFQSNNGEWHCNLPVANAFFGQIIGKGGEAKRRLEYETQTRIFIPPKGQRGDLGITSNTKAHVMTCRNRVLLIIGAARERQQFTHFISVPINCKSMRKNSKEFMDSVMWKCGESRGVDESIFQKPDRLHLTIGMLCLLSDSDREKAKDAFDKCINDRVRYLLPKQGRLKVVVNGLEYMNDDPAEVDVLYGKVVRPGGAPATIFQKIVDCISKDMFNTGFVPRRHYSDNVKLHVTLMNSRFRTVKSNTQDEEEHDLGDDFSAKKPKDSFDATKILKDLGDFKFGDIEIKEIHISQLHSSSKNTSGYYPHTHIVKL